MRRTGGKASVVAMDRETAFDNEPSRDRTRSLGSFDPSTSLRSENESIILEARSHLSERILYSFLVPTVTAAMVVSILILVVAAERIEEFGAVGIVIGSTFVIVLSPAAGFALYGLLQSLNCRRFVFDFRRRECAFTNVPGFGAAFDFDDIKSIEIIPSKGKHSITTVTLALSLVGQRRRLRIQWLSTARGPMGFGRPDPPETGIERIMPLANALAQLVGKPLRVNKNASVWSLSWR